ncbi:MAG: hypothetical protein CL912_10550 [Deltaproteobacteria bacterium]|nr:hypothetical protein [Deltaproteobacteria bacterium]
MSGIRDVLIKYSGHDHGANTSTHTAEHAIMKLNNEITICAPNETKTRKKVAKQPCTIHVSSLPSKSWQPETNGNLNNQPLGRNL